MIGEGDRQYLVTLIQREGIGQVLLALSEAVQDARAAMPRLRLVPDTPTLEEIVEVVEAPKPVIQGSRIVTASAPKRRSRQQPPELSGRIVHAAPKPKKGDDE